MGGLTVPPLPRNHKARRAGVGGRGWRPIAASASFRHMYETSDIRKGLKVLIDSQPCSVVEHQFVKPGKGQAFTRTKLRNLLSGSMLDRTFKSGEKLQPADIEERTMQFVYMEGDRAVFMDTSSFDQFFLSEKQLDDAKNYLLDGLEVTVLLFQGNPISVTPPNFVELEITMTEPGVKGDTATGATKIATLSTGLTLQVPLFVEQNEFIKVDTRTASYVERVKR